MDSKLPNLIDQHVGRRLRWRRRELKLSQERLAEILGVTFQQVQKYERGANRISAGRLFELARALDTTIAWFFDGFDAQADDEGAGAEAFDPVLAEDAAPYEVAPGPDEESAELLRAFRQIADPELRRSIVAMVRNSAALFDRGLARAD